MLAASLQQPPTPPVGCQVAATHDVLGAVGDSSLLAIEHAMRISFQEKTRNELSGPFWPDYVHSVRMPRQWEDTDAWYVNYVGHPIHGAAAGYNWLDHGPDGDVPFGKTPRYWAAKGRATAWAAAYSLQFEIGPLSEASIGNVGKRRRPRDGWTTSSRRPARWADGRRGRARSLLRRMGRDADSQPRAPRVVRMLFNPAWPSRTVPPAALRGTAPAGRSAGARGQATTQLAGPARSPGLGENLFRTSRV
jgi:hypothetical protein